MKPEQILWHRLRPLFQGLDPVRVENRADPGTPDVNYLFGWIELKVIKKWPENPNAQVPCKHYTAQQRVWSKRRSRAGGLVFMIVEVGKSIIVLEGQVAARLLGHTTREELEREALLVSDGLPSKNLLWSVICRKNSIPSRMKTLPLTSSAASIESEPDLPQK